MTESSVRILIETQTAATSYPVLTSQELDLCFNASKIADTNGCIPADVDWIPTYNPNYGIALGWEIKAAKVAGNYDFTDMGQKFSRSQVLKNCLMMAKRYRNTVLSSVKLVSELTENIPSDEVIIQTEDENG